MDFDDVIQSRRSVRRFSEQALEKESIVKVLECARLAPSWKNGQCWRFIVVTQNDMKLRIADALPSFNKWAIKAPAVVIACGEPSSSGERDGINYYVVDVSIAMEHLVLGAANIGLGTCWIGIFDEKMLKKILGVPENLRIVAISPLGYPAEKMGIKEKISRTIINADRRKPLTEIMHMEKW